MDFEEKKRRLVKEDCRKFAGKKVNNTKVGKKCLVNQVALRRWVSIDAMNHPVF